MDLVSWDMGTQHREVMELGRWETTSKILILEVQLSLRELVVENFIAVL